MNLYMFRAGLLLIIRRHLSVYTAVGHNICYGRCFGHVMSGSVAQILKLVKMLL